MHSRAHFGVFACVLLVSGLSGAQAQSVSKQNSADRIFGDKVSVELYGGYLSVESTELVLNPGTGHVDSKLYWKINKAAVIGGSITVSPRPWMTFKLSGWVPAASRNTMDDYDWLGTPTQDWTDLSHHDDTQLNHASMIDARVAVRFLALSPTQFADRSGLEAIAGFRRFNVAWTAKGGNFIYSSGGGFRNDIGNFAPGQTVIAYEQWMYTPYLGLGGTIGRGRWSFDGAVIGSLWAEARDRDDHVLRSTLFTDEFSRMKMVGVDATMNYALNDRFSLFGRYEYQQYFEARGPSTSNNYGTGVVTHTPGEAAAMSSYTMVLSLGLKGKL